MGQTPPIEYDVLFYSKYAGAKCDALSDLVPFVPFKKSEKDPWRSVNFSCRLKPVTLLKLTLFHWCFHVF